MPGPIDDVAEFMRAHSASVGAVAAAMLVFGLALAHESWEEPVRERQTVEVSRWSEHAEFTYDVPITRNATVWSEGTVLPMGMPAYYRTVSDHIVVRFQWRPEAADVAPVGLAQAELLLRIRGETPEGGTYWEIIQPLDEGVFRDLDTGVALEGVLHLDPLTAHIANITKVMPLGEGHVNWTVEAQLAYAIELADRQEASTERFVLPMLALDPRFILPAPEEVSWERPHVETSQFVHETKAGARGVLSDLRAQALVLAGGVSLALLGWAQSTDPARGRRPEEAAFWRQHARHREWITTSTGRLDESALAGTLVEVASLDELVRVAADARSRVLYDPHAPAYYVLLPNLAYRHAPFG